MTAAEGAYASMPLHAYTARGGHAAVSADLDYVTLDLRPARDEQGVSMRLLPAEALALAARLTSAASAACTCVGGSWCVLHGQCTCASYEERERGPLTHVMGNIWVEPRLHAPDCPLHGRPDSPPGA